MAHRGRCKLLRLLQFAAVLHQQGMSLTIHRLWSSTSVQPSLVLKGSALRDSGELGRIATTDATASAGDAHSGSIRTFVNPRHGEQSTVPARAAAGLSDAALLGAAHGARAWSVARTDPGVASNQLGGVVSPRGLCAGSPFSAPDRGLVCSRPSTTGRHMAEQVHPGGCAVAGGWCRRAMSLGDCKCAPHRCPSALVKASRDRDDRTSARVKGGALW
jgi:hypothetical protein